MWQKWEEPIVMSKILSLVKQDDGINYECKEGKVTEE